MYAANKDGGKLLDEGLFDLSDFKDCFLVAARISPWLVK